MAMRDQAVSLEVPVSERQSLQELIDFLNADGALQAVDSKGKTMALSPKLQHGLADLLRFLRLRPVVEVLPVDQELSPHDAADLLNVSRTFVYKLIERGDLPCRLVGAHKRVPLDALLSYKTAQAARQRGGLEAIAFYSEIQGGEIDEPYPGDRSR